MRSRIVLFIVLAVAIALLGIYLGRSTTIPTAVGEPATTTQADSSVGPTQRRGSGSGPSRPPTASSRKVGAPKAGANPGGAATQPGHQPATTPATRPQPSTGPVRFGTVTNTPSGNTAVLEVAPSDHRALSLGFSDREVQLGGNQTGDRRRSFSLTMPLTGGAKGETLRIYVQGYAFVQGDAYARLTLKLNGQSTVRYYRSGFDDSFVEALEVPATPATTYRLEGAVEVHRNPGSDATAYLNVLSVDASINR